MLFELGLGQVITQIVGHEAAHLKFNKDGSVDGPVIHIGRVASILSLLRRWYFVAAVVFAVMGSVIGGLIIWHRNGEISPENWLPVWIILVLLTGVNLYTSPQLALVEGTGQISEVATLRLKQSICGYGLLWLLLASGANLWASIAIPLFASLTTSVWLRKRNAWLIQFAEPGPAISWRKEIFPTQWRIATSWACGYLIFNLFTPIVFVRQGAIEAGRLGLAMTIFSSLTTLGLSWLNAKMPFFAMHIARNESYALNQQFKKSAAHAIAVTMVLSFAVTGIVLLATLFEIHAVQRISAPATLFWIACSSTANVTIAAAATYIRAHREEPLLTMSVVSALMTSAAVILTGESTQDMMFCNALISSCIGLPWTYHVFRKYWTKHDRTKVKINPSEYE